jgi:hypothetical protein
MRWPRGVQRAEACRRKQLHGRRRRVVLISRRWDQAVRRRFAGRRGLTSPVPRGERAISRNTIAQGMPVVPAALSLLACAKCTFFARKSRGCGQHPAFPAPSVLQEGAKDASPGHTHAAGMRTRALPLFDIRMGY